jgi:hypothetical protein
LYFLKNVMGRLLLGKSKIDNKKNNKNETVFWYAFDIVKGTFILVVDWQKINRNLEINSSLLDKRL